MGCAFHMTIYVGSSSDVHSFKPLNVEYNKRGKK